MGREQMELKIVAVNSPSPEAIKNSYRAIINGLIAKYGVENVRALVNRYDQMKKENLI